eukprot:Gb_40619 [translate_table: standard]
MGASSFGNWVETWSREQNECLTPWNWIAIGRLAIVATGNPIKLVDGVNTIGMLLPSTKVDIELGGNEELGGWLAVGLPNNLRHLYMHNVCCLWEISEERERRIYECNAQGSPSIARSTSQNEGFQAYGIPILHKLFVHKDLYFSPSSSVLRDRVNAPAILTLPFPILMTLHNIVFVEPSGNYGKGLKDPVEGNLSTWEISPDVKEGSIADMFDYVLEKEFAEKE